MISVPPQHWKSTISSQRAPAFVHMQDPTLNIALASYSQELSKSHLSKLRQILNWDRFEKLAKVNLISDTSTSYELKEWGTFHAVWVWWSLTGRPVDFGIIDDVHKDRAEYESDTIRNWVWDWYTSVWLSRLHKDSKQLAVMTRWWEDDLFGRILQLEPNEWEVINIPVIDWDTTIFPERFPLDFIQQKRWVMWERDFQALYMWDPINEWWGDFRSDYFQYYDELPKIEKTYMFIDPAISQKESADYTAIITVWITNDNRIYVLDIFRERVLPDEIIDNAIRIAETYSVNAIGIEIVQYQKMLSIELKKQLILRNKFFRVFEMRPSGEKVARIRSVLQPRYSLMTIFHKRYWKNVADMETEALKFPNWKHDDMIDALASAVSIASIEYWDKVEVKKVNEDDPLWLFEDEIDEVEIDFSPY
jgi:predicted phage terminase large subunit-like protein